MRKFGRYGFAVGLSAIPLSLQPLAHSHTLVWLAAAVGVASIPTAKIRS